MISFTGIYCGVEAVFNNYMYIPWHWCYNTCALNKDNTITQANEKEKRLYEHTYELTTLFPLVSDPNNIKNAVFKCNDRLMKYGENKKEIDASEFIKFEYNYSVIRVYRDVFLAYDEKTNSWVLLRIATP